MLTKVNVENIDTAVEDAAARLQSMGGARAILATAPCVSRSNMLATSSRITAGKRGMT